MKPSEIEHFINKMVVENNISQSYQKVLVGAIKLFYNELLQKNYKLNYLYPDRSEKNFLLYSINLKSKLCSIPSKI